MKKIITILTILTIVVSALMFMSCTPTTGPTEDWFDTPTVPTNPSDSTSETPSDSTSETPSDPEEPDDGSLKDELGEKAKTSSYPELKAFFDQIANINPLLPSAKPVIIASKVNSFDSYVKYRKAFLNTMIGDGVYGNWVVCAGFQTVSKGQVTYENVGNTDFHTNPIIAKLNFKDGVQPGFYFMDENYIYKLPNADFTYVNTTDSFMYMTAYSNKTLMMSVSSTWKVSYISKK